MSAMPTEVHIAHATWGVLCNAKATAASRKESKEKWLAGFCDSNKLAITIAHDLPVQVQQDTLLHEVMHAVYFTVGNPLHTKFKAHGDAVEELGVASLAPLLLGVIRDNPDLIDYLTWSEE
jgi:hypothetical protein